MYTIEQLNDKLLSELKAIAEDLKISGITKLSKKDLIYKLSLGPFTKRVILVVSCVFISLKFLSNTLNLRFLMF